MARKELEFKFRVADEGALRALVTATAGADAPLPPAVRQVNHFFDTPERAFGATGCALRLREEPERWILTAKGPGARRGDDALAVKAEEEAEITAFEARAVLAGEESPLALLEKRLAPPRPALLGTLRELAGGAPLVEIGAFTNHRRRLGPLPLATAAGPIDVVFELDRTELPGGVVHHEIEVEVSPAAVEPCRAALLELLERAGIPWERSSSKAKRFFALLAEQSRSTGERLP